MRYVCLSDTHGQHNRLVGDFTVPEGDVLVHAGDMTARGGAFEYVSFIEWMGKLPHPVKILVPGNHDRELESGPVGYFRSYAKSRGIDILIDQEIDVDARQKAVSAWGSPRTPEFNDWHFMYPRGGEQAEALWDAIPDGLDLLVTHGPPHGVRDTNTAGQMVGCEVLWRRLTSMQAPPRLHVFGHIHEAAGVTHVGRTICVNASVLDERYRLVRPPTVVEFDDADTLVRIDPYV